MTTVSAVFVPATDTAGSKIRVTESPTRRMRTYPFPMEASLSDIYTVCVERFAREVIGLTFPVIDYADGRKPSRGYRFTVWERTHDAECTGCVHDCPWRRHHYGAPYCDICADHYEASGEDTEQ